MSPRDNAALLNGQQRNNNVENGVVTRSSSTTSDGMQEDDLKATAEMCHHCFDVLINELHINTANNQSASSSNRSSLGVSGWRSAFNVGGGNSNTNNSSNNNEDSRNTTTTTTTVSDEISSSISLFINSISSSISAPLFVTWDKINKTQQVINSASSHPNNREIYDLRGCIGTLSSSRPLQYAISEYALTSALRDKRFNPIKKYEISLLRVTVSLLVNYESCTDVYDWVVGLHGIIIKFVDPNSSYNNNTYSNSNNDNTNGVVSYSATYLPEVAKEQGWSVQESIIQLIRKSGYVGPIVNNLNSKNMLISDDTTSSNSNSAYHRKPLDLNNIQCTKYQSSKYRLTYDEYVNRMTYDPLVAFAAKQQQQQKEETGKKRHRFVFF